jgi:hypothetical protein
VSARPAGIAECGCNEVTVEAVEVSCPLPDPSSFLQELEIWFASVPAYCELASADKERIQPYVEEAFKGVPVRHGIHVVPAVAHLAIGQV